MDIREDDLCQVTETVWTSVLGLAVRRSAGGPWHAEVAARSILGCVQISGAWDGAVLLESSPRLCRRATAILLGVDEGAATPDELRDTLGELVNIIGGNLKSMLPEPSKLSIPAVVEGADVTLRVSGSREVSAVSLDCDGEPLRVSLFQREATPAG